ncbi:MAG: type II toxin-antitoxin system VapC family toxin [Micropepsaceae bacterium]
MPQFLLDTNVVSELRRARPHGGVINWLSTLQPDEIFVSAVTFGEMQRGVEAARRADADKAREIEVWMEGISGSFQVLAMDRDMFREHARLMQRQSKAHTEDAMIAATARIRSLTVATRNAADFRAFSVPCFNPFEFKG